MGSGTIKNDRLRIGIVKRGVLWLQRIERYSSIVAVPNSELASSEVTKRHGQGRSTIACVSVGASGIACIDGHRSINDLLSISGARKLADCPGRKRLEEGFVPLSG